MQLYYFYNHHDNFGDAINDWLWDTLLPDRQQHALDVSLSGIGTILNHKMPTRPRWVVAGSGAGYGALPAGFGGANWDVMAVRGPLSARVLGLAPEKAITDGAILLSLLPEYAPAGVPAQRDDIVFMPHYMSVAGGAWAEACNLAGIVFIDPREDARVILARLRAARLVIADAMHAAIVADTLRTPWVAASLNSSTDSFKWTDWSLSMGLTHAPHILPSSTVYDAVRSRALPLYGERMLLSGADADRLCARHADNAATERSKLTFYRRKVMKRAAKEVAKAAAFSATRISPAARQQRIECAAVALSQLAAHATPTMSDDVVFNRQRDRMNEGLRKMAARYGMAVSGALAA